MLNALPFLKTPSLLLWTCSLISTCAQRNRPCLQSILRLDLTLKTKIPYGKNSIDCIPLIVTRSAVIQLSKKTFLDSQCTESVPQYSIKSSETNIIKCTSSPSQSLTKCTRAEGAENSGKRQLLTFVLTRVFLPYRKQHARNRKKRKKLSQFYFSKALQDHRKYCIS